VTAASPSSIRTRSDRRSDGASEIRDLSLQLAHLGLEEEHAPYAGQGESLSGEAEDVLDIEDLLA
jgi:hypothetical protein